LRGLYNGLPKKRREWHVKKNMSELNASNVWGSLLVNQRGDGRQFKMHQVQKGNERRRWEKRASQKGEKHGGWQRNAVSITLTNNNYPRKKGTRKKRIYRRERR